MTELKDVEIKTLAFMTGPFTLVSLESEMRDSTFRAGERYEVGLSLTVSNLAGVTFRASIPKKDVLYHRISAFMVEGRMKVGDRFNVTWDDKNGRVILSGAPAALDK